ncbi:restriction endonuclease subunit S [Halomonas sp. LS-001]
MNYPAYPEYKDSGVEWLGKVPVHWEVTALKRGHDVILGKMLQPGPKKESDQLLPYLRAANIQPTGVNLKDVRKMWFSPSEARQLALEYGDLLVSEGGDVGRPALWSNGPGYHIQNSINRVRPNANNCSSFLFYWMLAIKQKGFVDVLCNKSTIAHFTAEKVASVPTPFPPGSEQTQIATFLDHETARIDALVEEQQRLITLLKEKRQAVISHAVTKGLDPDVPMKDSGVEWLGEVPEHWGVQSINQVTQKITNGYVGPTRDILVSAGVPYVQATHIKNGVINFDGKYFVTPEWSNKMRKSILQEGDVLIVQTGAGTGDVAVVSSSEEGYNCHALIILQPVSEKLVGAYLAKFLQSHVGKSVLFSLRTGGMHPHLNCGEVKFIKMPIPSCEEQVKISAYISSISSVIDELTAESKKAIKHLQERRTALISAAVTGKIDVRGLQPPPEKELRSRETVDEV